MGSDHFPTITTVNATNASNTQERYYQNWKFLKENLQNNHHEIDLKYITTANLDDMVKMVQSQIIAAYKYSFVKINKKNKYIFLSKPIRILLEKKKRIRRAYQKNRSPLLNTTLNKLNSKIKTLLQKSNRDKWLHLCSTAKNSTKLWRKINKIGENNISANNYEININGVLTTNPQLIANEFGRQLESTFKLI
jgi:hypothetical protein